MRLLEGDMCWDLNLGTHSHVGVNHVVLGTERELPLTTRLRKQESKM